MDTVDTKTRSKIMSKVKQKGTGLELKLRKALHAKKFRYRVNVKKLPGSPDLVFTKYKAVIFLYMVVSGINTKVASMLPCHQHVQNFGMPNSKPIEREIRKAYKYFRHGLAIFNYMGMCLEN